MCFPLYHISKWLSGQAYYDIFVEIFSICNPKMICTHLVSVVIYPARLQCTGRLNMTDIQIISTCECLKYLQVNWSGLLLTDDMEHVISRLSKECVSV